VGPLCIPCADTPFLNRAAEVETRSVIEVWASQDAAPSGSTCILSRACVTHHRGCRSIPSLSGRCPNWAVGNPLSDARSEEAAFLGAFVRGGKGPQGRSRAIWHREVLFPCTGEAAGICYSHRDYARAARNGSDS
jgi:hypothetical protein